MTHSLDWTTSDDTQDIVHIIVQALVEGKLVALPAETAYHVFASGLRQDAVDAMAALGGRNRVRSPSMFLRSSQESLDYSPDMSRVASRAVRRGWPGPLVLELPVESPASLSHQLPAGVRSQLLSDQRFMAQRVGSHDAILQAMRLMPGPLVAAPVVDSSGGAICSGKDTLHRLQGDIDLVVDDGITHYGGFATTVRIDGNRCTVLTEGVVDHATLDQLFQLIVLLVCTGNTCRSPMAEVLLRDLLQQRFPVQTETTRPLVQVSSAGLSAFPGGPASSEAQTVMKKRKLNLQGHESRAVTERTLRYADSVLTMTNSHRAAIVEKIPGLAARVQLLSGSGQDVSDPFGGSEGIYSLCADQLDGYLKRWIEQVDESWFPQWNDAKRET